MPTSYGMPTGPKRLGPRAHSALPQSWQGTIDSSGRMSQAAAPRRQVEDRFGSSRPGGGVSRKEGARQRGGKPHRCLVFEGTGLDKLRIQAR